MARGAWHGQADSVYLFRQESTEGSLLSHCLFHINNLSAEWAPVLQCRHCSAPGVQGSAGTQGFAGVHGRAACKMGPASASLPCSGERDAFWLCPTPPTVAPGNVSSKVPEWVVLWRVLCDSPPWKHPCWPQPWCMGTPSSICFRNLQFGKAEGLPHPTPATVTIWGHGASARPSLAS